MLEKTLDLMVLMTPLDVFMVVYVKCFDSNKTMSFKIKDNGLLRKYTKILQKN